MLFPKTVILLGSATLLVGCTSSAQQSARVLQQRLQSNLAPQVANHQATIDNFPDGARVTLDEPVLFNSDHADLSTDGGYVIASVTESLLDPRLMQVDVTDTSAGPDDLRNARVRSVQHYVEANQLGPSLPVETRPQPAVSRPAQTMVVTVRVHCPPGPQGSTWGYPNRAATCN